MQLLGSKTSEHTDCVDNNKYDEHDEHEADKTKTNGDPPKETSFEKKVFQYSLKAGFNEQVSASAAKRSKGAPSTNGCKELRSTSCDRSG